MLELRFPATEAGWRSWWKLVDVIRRSETGYYAKIEEIAPGQIMTVVRLK